MFRNNTGVLKDKTGRPVKFGLCPGSSDIIGWTEGGVFLAIEVKLPNKTPTDNQWNFINRAKAAGCKAGFATSVDEALEILK